MITAHEVYEAEFRRAEPGTPGYDEVAVDDFLDRVVDTLTALEAHRRLPAGAVTSQETVEIDFPERHAFADGGYDMDDVDDLLDRVAQRLFTAEQGGARTPRALAADDEFERDDDGGVGDAAALATAAGAPDEGASVASGAAGRGVSDDAVREGGMREEREENVPEDGAREEGVADEGEAGFTPVEEPRGGAFAEPGMRLGAEAGLVCATHDDAADAPEHAEADHADALSEPVEAEGVGRSVGTDLDTESAATDHVGTSAATHESGARDESETVEAPRSVVAPGVASVATSAVAVGEAARVEPRDATVNDTSMNDIESHDQPDGGAIRREPLAENGVVPADDISDEGDARPAASALPVDGADIAREGETNRQAQRPLSGINPVGGEPLSESASSPAPASANRSEAVHPVGSGLGAFDANARRDDASSTHHDSADGNDVVDRDEVSRVGSAATFDPEIGRDADVAKAPESSEVATAGTTGGAEASPEDVDGADVRAAVTTHEAPAAPDEVEGRDAEAHVEADSDVRGRAPESASESRSRSMGQSWQHAGGVGFVAAPADASADAHTSIDALVDEHTYTEKSAPAPEPIVSYPATDHRVPLPRGDVRRSMTDDDLEAEAHYHPEFSSYATPESPVAAEGAGEDAVVAEPAGSEIPPTEPAATEPAAAEADHRVTGHADTAHADTIHDDAAHDDAERNVTEANVTEEGTNMPEGRMDGFDPSADEDFDPFAKASQVDALRSVAPANEETARERAPHDPWEGTRAPAPVAAELKRRAQERERLAEQAQQGSDATVAQDTSADGQAAVVSTDSTGSADSADITDSADATHATASSADATSGYAPSHLNDASIGRPQPIDAPASIDEMERPATIETPKPLPPRDDTSRKGLLRRIFKG